MHVTTTFDFDLGAHTPHLRNNWIGFHGQTSINSNGVDSTGVRNPDLALIVVSSRCTRALAMCLQFQLVPVPTERNDTLLPVTEQKICLTF